MLVRAGDGEWLQLRPLEEMPSGGFRALCGQDAANLLEIDEPLPVVAFGESGDQQMVDAICLTREGGIALLAATFGERADSTLWRLMNVAGTLRGMSFELFSANCSELHGASPAHWLAERVGGDAGRLEGRMREVLEHGTFELVLVTTDGPGELATPMRFLQQGPASVRVYEIELLRAGDVQAVEGAEVTLDGERTEPRRVQVVETAAPAPAEPEQAWTEPEPEWQAEQEEDEPSRGWEPEAVFEQAAEAHRADLDEPAPQPDAVEPPAEEPIAEEPVAEEPVAEEPPAEEAQPEPAAPVAEEEPPVATEVEPEPLGEPSDHDSFVAAVDRLDHKSSAHMRFLHERLLTFVGSTEYTRDDKLEYFVGWTREDQPRPLVGLDSAGSFTVVLSSLPQDEQLEYAAELASLADAGDGSTFMELGVAELSVIEHLNDQSLLEYVLDNLQEALPGGRELFEEVAAPAPAQDGSAEPTASDDDEIGDDFFAGVSADHDPAEVAQVTGAPEPAEQPAAEAPAAPEPVAPQQGQKKGGFARRLRRRDAA